METDVIFRATKFSHGPILRDPRQITPRYHYTSYFITVADFPFPFFALEMEIITVDVRVLLKLK